MLKDFVKSRIEQNWLSLPILQLLIYRFPMMAEIL
jgi:hypothetical protein